MIKTIENFARTRKIFDPLYSTKNWEFRHFDDVTKYFFIQDAGINGKSLTK